jgi:hypothetical protein
MSAYRILTVCFPRVRSLSIILQNVEIELSERDLTDDKAKSLREIVKECHKVLETLDKTLDKYQGLSPNHKDSKPKGKILRVWKRLKWEPDDIISLRNHIISNITMLNTFYSQLNR